EELIQLSDNSARVQPAVSAELVILRGSEGPAMCSSRKRVTPPPFAPFFKVLIDEKRCSPSVTANEVSHDGASRTFGQIDLNHTVCPLKEFTTPGLVEVERSPEGKNEVCLTKEFESRIDIESPRDS